MMIIYSIEESGCVFEEAGSIKVPAEKFLQVSARSGKERSWLWGVLEVVADMVGQCGSKRDARRPGEREKMTMTQTFRQ